MIHRIDVSDRPKRIVHMKYSGKILVGFFSAWFLSGLDASAQNRIYMGFCEASAAVRISDTRVAVSSDDYSSILIFERGTPKAVGSFPVGDVTDIEAAARIGDSALWVTSHSVTAMKKKDKPERMVVFATSVAPEGGMTATGVAYQGALRGLVAQALGQTEGDIRERFNIEGVAETAKGTLLVGLRGPLDAGGGAMLVEIANPLTMVGLSAEGAAPKAITSVRLDLSDGPGTSGRGVRDIARVGERYLILAGAEPDGGNPLPKLFWWDGTDQNGLSPGPAANFTGMTPEAIVVWDEHSAEIFSDDGGAVINGIACKDDKTLPPDAHFSALDVQF